MIYLHTNAVARVFRIGTLTIRDETWNINSTISTKNTLIFLVKYANFHKYNEED